MFFLRKNVTSEGFAKILFELFLKELKASNNYKKIFEFEKQPKFFEEETPMFLVFLFLHVIEQKIKEEQKRDLITYSFLRQIKNYLLVKFSNNENQTNDFLETIRARCDEYNEALQNNMSAGPLWHLSRKVINNIFGEDILSAVLVDQFTAMYIPLWEFIGKKISSFKIT